MLFGEERLRALFFCALINSSRFFVCPGSWLSGVFAVVLAGCSSGSLVTDTAHALYHQQFDSVADITQTAALNPAYSYLRAELTGYPSALLVLGYVDAHPNGDVEIWYGANKEVIRIQQGRIVGTAGLPLNWRNVHYVGALPSWGTDPSGPQAVVRVRDEMPGYRYGLQDQLSFQAIAGVAPIVLPQTLPPQMAQRYQWYREAGVNASAGGLPASWFAVGPYQGKQTVVFTYQCLGPDACLSLQRWPPEKGPS